MPHRATEPDDNTPITGTFGAQKRTAHELAQIRGELVRARKQRLVLGVLTLLWAAIYLYRWVISGN